MAKYTGMLTDKQKEMLEPLEKEVKEIMREKEKLRKILAFKQYIGFDENVEIRRKMEDLEKRHMELSKDISIIYGAQDEMVKHMKKAIEEIKMVDSYCYKYGFVVDKEN